MEEFEIPKLRLWARMISSNLHESTEEPPNIPAFSGCARKKAKQDLTPQTTFSPSTLVDVRMKNYEQLRYIKQLHLDNILTDNEFEECYQEVIEIKNLKL